MKLKKRNGRGNSMQEKEVSESWNDRHGGRERGGGRKGEGRGEVVEDRREGY